MKSPSIEDLYRLSPVQEGMLFHTLQDHGDAAPYFEQFVITYPRGLETARAERAWRRLTERHPILRTSFFWEEVEEPVQLVHRRAEMPFEHLDLRAFPPEERERRLEAFLLEDRRRGFALDRAPLMRATIVRWEGEVCRLVWSYHHLLLDGWSVGLLLQEISALYDADPDGPPPALPPTRPFRDYIAWLRQQDLKAAEAYWRRELAELREPFALGFDRHPGQPVAPGDAHARGASSLPEAVTAALAAFARQNRLTFHTLVEGAWALALSRCSAGLGGARDVVFGNTVSGRPASLPGAAVMVGCFINTLPVRVRIDPARPLLPWLQELQAGQLELRRYEHSPLVEVRRWAGVPAGRSLFDALLVFENAALLPADESEWTGFQRTNYPLTVQVWPARVLRMEAGFYRGRFEPEAVSRFLALVETFLRSFLEAGVGARLIDLPALAPAEARQIAVWNQTRTSYPPERCLHDAVAEQARRTPEAVAASYEGASLTYRELEERANRLAHYLRRLGVRLEDRVGVALERSLDLSVALLAVLKAGGAYVPLEPSYPAERLAMLAEDACGGHAGDAAPVVLTHSRLLNRLPSQVGARIVALDEIGEGLAAESPEPPPALAAPDSLAYVLFTSGSTGRPKGAGNTHRGVLNRLLWMQEAYGLTADDRVLQKTPFSFDVSGWELWWPLLTGARLVYAAPGGHQDPAYLVRLMAEEGITTVHFVPSMLAVFLDEPGLDRLTALRRLVASGEALAPALVRRAFSRLPARVEVHNLYGPTEAAIDVTAWTCAAGDPEAAGVPIGRPIANTRIHVLDADLRPVPVGIPGELGIAGVQVGRGYLGRPDLTAERFVPEAGGERLYRTGDLARWRPDGALEYLGRLDHQVKVRGVRIELGEIESVLASLPGVREAVVLARHAGDEPGDLRLVAYVVTEADAASLRERLRAVLPEALIPAAFVPLQSLPLSPNGKVDRKALPAPEGSVSDAAGYVPPRDETEEALAEVWAALLKAERVGATDNFFALGGDSIKAVRLVSRANTRLSTGLRVQDVFQHPTVEALAGRIAAARAERSLAEERAAGLAEIERRREAVLADERWRGRLPADAEDFFPLSGIEKGMVYYSLLLPDQPIYHDQYAYLLSIDDMAVFFRALELLVGRHEILRTTFHLYDFPEPMKVVRRRIPLSWEVEDLRGLAAEEQHRRVARHRAEDLRRKFTFDGELLWRLRLFRLEERLFCAVWTWHHATLDGWSNVVFWQEMNDLCGRRDLGGLEPLPPLASSYKDYVAITLGRGRSERTEAFWKETLAGAERNKLPFHRSTVRAGETFGMRTTERLFGGGLLGALRSRARQLGTSLQALCLAGHVHLLRVTTGEADVVTGVVSHDRPGIPDGDRIIGCFLNTVPVRLRAVAGESGRSLAERVTRYLAAEKEHEIPLPDIAALVGVQEAGGNPIFDTLLNFTDFHAMEEVDENRLFRPDALTAPRAGLDLASSEMTNTLFDVEVSATLGRFGVRIKYSPRHFEPADVARAADLYGRILEALARDPEAPLGVEALLSPEERGELVHRYNDTAREYPRERPLHGFFAEQAALRPEAEALVCGGRSLSYGELERQANRLAHALVQRGVRPGENVGICWERSVDLMAGMLAILKAGGAYVPLEASYPAARKGYIVRQSQVSRILADREYELQEGTARTTGTAGTDGAPVEILVIDPAELAAYPDTPPAIAPPRPEDLAYTIYTSGSTGNPKGVMIEHHSAANLIAWVNREFSVGPGDRVLMLSSVCFDLSVYDLFGGLGAGATVVVARREEIEDPAALKRLVVEQRVAFWDSVPSTLGLLVQYLEDTDPGFRGADLRLAFLSGDWIPLSLPERARRFFPNLSVISLGGATEGTIWSIFRPIGELDPAWVSIPYGRPLDNNAFYVLDRHRELVPVGVAGDLYIGGLGVARGYSGEAVKTAASFGPDPFSQVPGARLYRTGDLGRMMAHGEIEFLGRSDHQVKVRGFRVELGEIESQLGRCPGIREAVVLARPDRAGQKYLCAYVVGPTPEAIPASPEIQAHLARHLPDYMVPDVFVRLTELPLTANGKIDRAALPDPGADEAGLAEEYLAPAGEVETALVEIWEEVLGVKGIGARHDFFTLGGHSLSAIQVLTRVRSRFGVDLPLPAFFESPTVAGAGRVIARLLAQSPRREDGEPAIVPALMGQERPERLPLSFAQERFWFLYRLDPASAAFNIGGTVRLDGRLSVPALAASIDEVLRRHEALRTRFRQEGEERFQIVDPFAPVELPVADLSGLPEAVRGPEAERVIQAATLRPFDLSHDRLLRPLLVRLGADRHIAHFTLHHIVGDGWSMGILLREMAALYRAFLLGQPSPLPPLPVQYPDFALWQRRWLAGERLERQLGYWRRRLAAPLPTLELPAQRPRPSTPRFRGAAETMTVPRHLEGILGDLGRAEGATPFMVFLAAFESLLHLYSGETDLLVGINVANRGRREVEDLIGFFVNNLVLRTDLSGDPTFREAVRRLRDVAVEAFAHQDVPYEMVLEQVQPDRWGSYAPLFQVMFVYQSLRADLGEHRGGGALPGVEMSAYTAPVRTANFDLTLTLNETGGDLLGRLAYDTDLFEPAFIARMVEHFRTLLEEVAADPDRPLSEIPIASENQARQLTSAFSEEL